MSGIALDPRPQPADVDVDGARVDVGIISPYGRNDRATVEDAVGKLHQKPQQLKLAQERENLLPFHKDLVGIEIDPQSALLVDVAWPQ